MPSLTRSTVVVVATAFLTPALMPISAHADTTCTAADRVADDRGANRGEALERDGKAAEALELLHNVSTSECASGPTRQRAKAAFRRVARTLGEQTEKAGQFVQANEYFDRGEHMVDADRAMRKHAHANKSKVDPLARALHYFKGRGDAAAQAEVRALAEAAGNLWLQAEEKTFAGGRQSSVPDLASARSFLRLVSQAAEQRTTDRAVQRGDAMAKGTTPKALDGALAYYGFAEARDKEKSVVPIARRYGDAAAQRGEHRIAEQFYALSGDDAKTEAMEKSREKTEGKRQKDFKKGQDDLEKELKL